MEKQARFFKALADETRLQILWLLMGTQSKSSRHLRYLFNVGLVSDRSKGVWMNYRLSYVGE